MQKIKFICIGTSAGGVDAIQKVISPLAKNFRLPIAIVLHLPSESNVDFELVYSRYTQGLPVEIKDKMSIQAGRIYFAPANYHLLVEKDFTFSLSLDVPVNYSRPSIDVFFESCARSLGNAVCGILLTGANEDGAQGLKDIKEAGGLTVIQDPQSSAVPFMPLSALQLFQPDYILGLSEISDLLFDINERML